MQHEHWKKVASLQRRRDRKEALCTSPWALPLAVAIIGLRPLKFIRICGIRNERIGHFVPDGAEQVVRYKRRGPKETRIYYFAVPVSCNQQWETMLRRTLPVKSRSLRHVVRWLRRLPGGINHVIPSTHTQGRDTEGLFVNGDAALPFTPQEEVTALKWLESKGWTKGEPFICLLVRDAAFTASDPVANHGFETDPSAWDYHSYRNSNIESYVPAIEWLNEQGVWVFRMGRIMEEQTPYSGTRFLDYAFDCERSDLLDIWLFARARAVISTGTGQDALAAVYGRPILMVNFLPLAQAWSWCACVTAPKPLFDVQTGYSLNARQQITADFVFVDCYADAGITWKDLTREDLREIVKDFWTSYLAPQALRQPLSEDFWHLLRSTPASKYHGHLHPRASVVATWSRKPHSSDPRKS